MLTGIHFLLTYSCNLECEHCFVYSSPRAKGTFTLEQLTNVLDEAVRLGSIAWIYFEGGEPFLFYPLMLEGIRLARERGFQTGVVTNAYWATTVADAELWLRPLAELQLADFTVSDDLFHHEQELDNSAKRALAAAERLGMPSGSICIERPTVKSGIEKEQELGAPVIGGGAMFRGRAVETLLAGLPTRSWEQFTTCPYEDLGDPERVHTSLQTSSGSRDNKLTARRLYRLLLPL